jgi:hypothetical protein
MLDGRGMARLASKKGLANDARLAPLLNHKSGKQTYIKHEPARFESKKAVTSDR